MKKKETIWKAFEENKCKFKKMRTCEKRNVDECFFEWFKNKRHQNFPINGRILQIRAEIFFLFYIP